VMNKSMITGRNFDAPVGTVLKAKDIARHRRI
jgi:hypothetical protein